GWCPGDDGSWSFWLADATGHGASAALLTALAAQLFHQACDRQDEPEAIIGAVNREFHKVFHGRAFMTAGCARIEPAGGRTFAGAGHPPLLVRRARGSVDVLDSQGTILGFAEDGTFQQKRTRLEAGDTALLYSDGLFAFKLPNGERFTHEDLRQILRAIAP